MMNWAHRYVDASVSSVIGSSNPVVVAALAGDGDPRPAPTWGPSLLWPRRNRGDRNCPRPVRPTTGVRLLE